MEKYFNYKGYLNFVYSNDSVNTYFFDKENTELLITLKKMSKEAYDSAYVNEFRSRVYDLFDGKEFISLVRMGTLTDYDGYASDIFVNGYKSNLGLFSPNMLIEGFMVDLDYFESLCETNEIKVNWVNK